MMKLKDLVFNGGGRLGSSFFDMQAESTKVFLQERALNIFGQYVRRVLRPWDASQAEISSPEPVLHPEVGCGKMANLAQPPPAANSDSRCCICLEVELPCQAEICRHTDKAKAC